VSGLGTGRIVCLGDAMVDVLALLPAPLTVGSDTPAPISVSQGGSAANTAAWLASIGSPSAFLGRVGQDAFGEEVTRELESHGVEVAVAVDGLTSTGVCLVLIGPDGERTMIPSAGANDRLSTEDIDAAQLSSHDQLHLSGYALLKEGSRQAARYALEAAARLGIPISVDAASAEPIRQIGAERLMDWLPAASTLLANRDEASVLSGVDDPAEAAQRLAARFARVVVKCGGQGAVTAEKDGQSGRVTLEQIVLEQVSAEPVTVLDSTGAGDAFAAGLLHGLRTGGSLREAAQAGNRLGALAVSRVGGRPPLPGKH
jgi:ribokinase